MALAGYVFNKSQASKFSSEWQKCCKSFGISFAHMTDCALGFGQYEGMDKPKRVEIQKALIALIRKRSLCSVSAAIDPNQFEGIMQGAKYGHSAYTFLMLTSVKKVQELIFQKDSNAKIAYIFEAGHRHQKEANRFMSGIREYGEGSQKGYISHSFEEKNIAVPLQAADMLAWHLHHFLARARKGHIQKRKDYLALIREQDVAVEISETHIRAFRELLDISAGDKGNILNKFAFDVLAPQMFKNFKP